MSTLRRFVHAMGGELVITAEFADTETPIVIDLFSEVAHSNSEVFAGSIPGVDLSGSILQIADEDVLRVRRSNLTPPPEGLKSERE